MLVHREETKSGSESHGTEYFGTERVRLMVLRVKQGMDERGRRWMNVLLYEMRLSYPVLCEGVVVFLFEEA